MPHDLAPILTAAIRDAEDRLDHDLTQALSSVPDDSRTLDALERAIDDVQNATLERELRKLLKALDEGRAQMRQSLSQLRLHQDLDPIRTIATDLASGQL